MMSLIEYAGDVNKSVDEIKALCDKIGIAYENEDSTLTEDDIILLDNEIQDQEDYISDDDSSSYVSEDELDDEEVSEKAEALAQAANIDLDNQERFEKVKTKVVKKQKLKIILLKKERKYINIVKNYKVMKLNKMIMLFYIKMA